jgi:putative tricarboxylic transport membrane protein
VQGGEEPAGGHSRVRIPADLIGGLALAGVAALALYSGRTLEGAQGVNFGPGTAPRIFAVVLAAAGVLIAILGLVGRGAAAVRYAVRGPLFITAAVLVFAAAIHPFGLVVSSYITILVASAANPETKWLEAAGWGAVLTAFCTLLFAYGLGLPLPLWPQG